MSVKIRFRTYIIPHFRETFITVAVSLLQPSPEVFHEFDDLILMAQGWVVFEWAVRTRGEDLILMAQE